MNGVQNSRRKQFSKNLHKIVVFKTPDLFLLLFFRFSPEK